MWEWILGRRPARRSQDSAGLRLAGCRAVRRGFYT